MDWKSHLKWGFIAVITTIILLIIIDLLITHLSVFDLYGGSNVVFVGIAIPNLLISFTFGIYASILPDIDIRTSKAYLITHIIIILIMVYFLIFTVLIIPVFMCMILMVFIMGLKHRGIVHKWYSGILVGCIFGWLFGSYLMVLLVIVGYQTHLICDYYHTSEKRKETANKSRRQYSVRTR